MKRYAATTLLLLLFALAGCAQLGLTKPETFEARIAAAYSANAGARQTATTLLNAKRLSSADGQNILTQTDIARQGLDVARGMHKTDPKAGENKLNSVRAVLQAIQAYLLTQQESK